MRPVVVILGASGRLGRRLEPSLAGAGFDTIGVARTANTCPPDSTRRITADLTIPEDRSRVATTVATWTATCGRVCIVDVVLDRRNVDTMRHSVHAVTDTVLRLRDCLRTCSAEITLIAASTTAVLAPGLYQTPYGLAKRQQVVTYARSGMAGGAVLLPVLSQQTGTEADRAQWPLWSFDQAADQLTATVIVATSRRGFAIHVPDLARDQAAGAGRGRASAAQTVLVAHMQSLVTNRNSMPAHRNAARARLGLSPSRIRRRVDHHLAPAELVRRFASRYHVTVIHETTSEPPPERR